MKKHPLDKFLDNERVVGLITATLISIGIWGLVVAIVINIIKIW